MDEQYWHDMYVEGEIRRKYMESYAKERNRILETCSFDKAGGRLDALQQVMKDSMEHELRRALHYDPTRWE